VSHRATPPRKVLGNLQNTVTREWHTFNEDSLLDQFAAGELSFVSTVDQGTGPKNGLENLARVLMLGLRLATPPSVVAF
jgi:hypothetical protein